MTIEELSKRIEILENRVEKYISEKKKISNTIISTIKCPECGSKTKAIVGGDTISFFCTNTDCNCKSQMLTIDEIVAIINFNPLT